jgi:acyl carrier protein
MPTSSADETMSAVATLVHQFLPDAAGTPAFDPDMELAAAGLGSLATVSLLVALEHHFKVVIPANLLQADAFHSIRTITELVHTAQRRGRHID